MSFSTKPTVSLLTVFFLFFFFLRFPQLFWETGIYSCVHIFQTVRHPEGFVRLIFDKDSQRSSRFRCTEFFFPYITALFSWCGTPVLWTVFWEDVHILCAHQRFRNRATTRAAHTIVGMSVAHSFVLEGSIIWRGTVIFTSSATFFLEISASVPYIVWIYCSHRLMLLFIYLSHIKKSWILFGWSVLKNILSVFGVISSSVWLYLSWHG